MGLGVGWKAAGSRATRCVSLGHCEHQKTAAG